MKKIVLPAALLLTGALFLAATRHSFFPSNSYGLKTGTPAIKSISALSFGNDGVLFIGDSKGAAVFAVDTKDNRKNTAAAPVEISHIDQAIATALGTQKENITITDMAVNPISKKIYIAVQNSDGTPVLLTIEKGKIQSFSLNNVAFSTIGLNDVVAEDAKDGRGRPTRVATITDIGFANGKVMVTGISNKEFSSTFRIIPFPFVDKQDESSLEIYHTSHGRYETAAPIRTFTTGKINGKDYLIASYTCTPLVLFPLEDLKPGEHVKGRTVAEMGSGNTPIDMITIAKGSDAYLVMANTANPVAAVNYKNIAAFEGTLTERVAGTAGANFDKLSLTNVLQMDKLDDTQVVMIQKKSDGSIDMWTAKDDTF